MNFAGGFIKTAYHGTLPIMEHFSKCELQPVLYSVIVLVVCYFLIQFIRSFDSAM